MIKDKHKYMQLGFVEQMKLKQNDRFKRYLYLNNRNAFKTTSKVSLQSPTTAGPLQPCP
jgi:hypothetical protein